VGDDGRVRLAVVLVVGIVVVGALGLVGCGASAAPKVGPGDVLVANFSFTPSTITVHVGESVTWVFDQPTAPHNVDSTSGPGSFDSGQPQGTGMYTHEFITPGTYTYICTVHPFMKGTVIVTQ